jgi:hypothetical protein
MRVSDQAPENVEVKIVHRWVEAQRLDGKDLMRNLACG